MTTEQKTPRGKKIVLPNIILIIGLGILLCGEAYFGYHLQLLTRQRQHIKEDYSAISSITFGLFSVDQWRDKMSAVIDRQVSDFNITPEQKKALQTQIEGQLHALISKTLAEINKPPKTFIGKLKKVAVNKFVDADQIQAQVPSFSKTIVDKISSPASTKRLKDIANVTINKLEDETYDSTETASNEVTAYMYHKYHVANAAQLNKKINFQLSSIRTTTYNYLYAMLGCVMVALLLWWVMRKQVHLHTSLFFMSLLFALVLLTIGITSPIIEVDAQIKAFNFTLMGENVPFGSQDLFFQSKSILGIVEVLIGQPKPDAVMVGILILVFVIVFPVVRILAKGIHILSTKKFAENKVVRYLAFDSGKWDMADVMVVGIVMTYIGLNGILKNQLSNLEMHNSFIDMSTANNTSLQSGYIVFVSYVVFAMILSAILKRITPKDVMYPPTA